MTAQRVRWALFVLFVVLLVAGGVNRTMAIAGTDGGTVPLSQGAGLDQDESDEGGASHGYGSAARAPRATEWRVLEGRVARVDTAALLLEVEGGERMLVEGETWAYARGQGFTAAVGDTISVDAFQEAGELKAGRLINRATGQEVTVRDRDGWPMWSRGRQR